MEDKIKVAKKKTWWDENDIIKAFLKVADDASNWVAEAGEIDASKVDVTYYEALGEVAGCARLVKNLLEATDAD